MSLVFQQVSVGPMDNFAYIIGCSETGIGAIIDPGWEGTRLVQLAKESGLRIEYILNTHAHFDHVLDNPVVKKLTGAKIVLPRNELPVWEAGGGYSLFMNDPAPELPPPDQLIEGNTNFRLGTLDIRLIDTPGHSPGEISFLVKNILLAGDVIFSGGSIGRTDLPGADEGTLMRSLSTIARLPGETLIYSGHGYTGVPFLSLEEEKKINPFLQEAIRLFPSPEPGLTR